MTKAIFDSATTLIPSGTSITGNQSFPAINVGAKLLPTAGWCVNVLTPPAGAVTFTLAVGSTETGPWTTISTLDWPAGQVGSKQIELGVSGNVATMVNSTAAWVRCSIVAGASSLTCLSWLGKPSGSPGVFRRGNDLVNAF
jgi:hypothetical protein